LILRMRRKKKEELVGEKNLAPRNSSGLSAWKNNNQAVLQQGERISDGKGEKEINLGQQGPKKKKFYQSHFSINGLPKGGKGGITRGE